MKDLELVRNAYRLMLGREPESEQVLDLEFENVFALRNYFINSDEYYQLIKNENKRLNLSNYKERIIISNIVICVGHACTLKCKNCGNLTPHMPNSKKRYNIKNIIRDLEIITEYTYINLLQIQGGEPFIYPYLSELLKYCIKNNAINNIHIATNGTIMPKVNVNLLKNPKVVIRVSNYPNVKIKGKLLEDFFIKYSINYTVYNFLFQKTKWIDLGIERNINYYNGGGGGNNEKFKNCNFNHCLTLEDSKIGHCARSISASAVQGFNPNKDDYLIVENRPTFRDELYNYINQPHFMEACRYCKGTHNIQFIEPAIQL